MDLRGRAAWLALPDPDYEVLAAGLCKCFIARITHGLAACPCLDTPSVGALARTCDYKEEEQMPKYRFEASYTVRGEEGVRAKGGTDRRDAVADAVRSVGGELECLYFEFGDRDAFSIVDLPDDEAAAAVALIANASGGATVKTTVLLTPEQVDEAANRAVTYRPPGL
jgi:uncharacterized protein with GYD domain